MTNVVTGITLPDYSKLPVILNQSGIQDSNPALYQVIKQLCDALQFAQATLISGELINTLPLGALIGDGSIKDPLGVKVDGTTVTINASDQLVATPPAGGIQVYVTPLSTVQIQNLNTNPVVVLPAATSKIAIPVWAMVHGTSGPVAAGTPSTRLVWAPGSGFHALDFPSAPWPGGGGGTNIYVYNSFGGTFGTLPGSGGPIVSQPVYIENSANIVGAGLIYSGIVSIGAMYI